MIDVRYQSSVTFPRAGCFDSVEREPEGSVIIRFRSRWVRLNHSAGVILGLCDGQRSITDIAGLLSGDWKLVFVDLLTTVFDAVHELAAQDLVELQTAAVSDSGEQSTPRSLAQDWVEEQIRFRMGRFYRPVQPRDPDWEARTPAHCKLIRFREGRVVWEDARKALPNGRLNHFLAMLECLEIPESPFSLVYAGGDDAAQSAVNPMHGHFRVCGSDATILWPLYGYTSVDSENFGANVHKSDCDWEDKIERAVWRGTTTGGIWRGLTEEELEFRLTLPLCASDHVAGRSLHKGSRICLVAKYFDADFADIGLSGTAQVDEVAKSYFSRRGFIKRQLPRRELLRYKYQIVVDGNTFASQLPWTLHCSSVVLMVPPSWEAIMADITPWHHYVPLAADYSDLEEKVDWCRSHDSRCREISEAATILMRGYYDPAKEARVQQGVLERYAQNYPDGHSVGRAD